MPKLRTFTDVARHLGVEPRLGETLKTLASRCAKHLDPSLAFYAQAERTKATRQTTFVVEITKSILGPVVRRWRRKHGAYSAAPTPPVLAEWLRVPGKARREQPGVLDGELLAWTFLETVPEVIRKGPTSRASSLSLTMRVDLKEPITARADLVVVAGYHPDVDCPPAIEVFLPCSPAELDQAIQDAQAEVDAIAAEHAPEDSDA